MENPTSSASFESWAIVSLFGHHRIVGYVSETKLAGGAFLKVDRPTTDGTGFQCSTFVSPASVYSIQPVDKEIALEMARSVNSDPVQPYDVPKLSESIREKFVIQEKRALPSTQDSVDEEEPEQLF